MAVRASVGAVRAVREGGDDGDDGEGDDTCRPTLCAVSTVLKVPLALG